jgi:hypothetical protein
MRHDIAICYGSHLYPQWHDRLLSLSVHTFILITTNAFTSASYNMDSQISLYSLK